MVLPRYHPNLIIEIKRNSRKKSSAGLKNSFFINHIRSVGFVKSHNH
ncbi:hypothetical protein D1BOALGB6SA_4614 [Olavius sp. associated proteobacterium Delta 1]|nr:hypothetical protein D1BOALGB6SA_4614 [Olavius sp. associated proteobacterium Delta 1]